MLLGIFELPFAHRHHPTAAAFQFYPFQPPITHTHTRTHKPDHCFKFDVNAL